MDKFSKSCLFLSSTILLWFLHISMPLFNSILPTVTLPAAVPNSTVEFIHIPSAQLLNLLVGLTTFLSAYSLLYVCAERNISLLTQFVFLTSGFFVTTGHGMHMVCVVMEEQMKETDKLFPLEYFLHEKLSHNLFIPGMFAVCGLIMNAEMKSVLSRLREKKGKEGNTDKINSSSKLWITILLWIGPIFMGSYFSVFSTLTGTVTATMVFYLLVYFFLFLSYHRLSSLGVSSPFSLLHSTEMVVCSSFAKAAIVGIPVILLKITLFH